jgi:lipopolysaccharide export system permease protein
MLNQKKISKVLLRAFIGPFIVTFLVSLFVFELQFIWLYIDDLMGKGLSFWIILQLLLFVSARIVNMALPLAILMSSIMTIGALSEHNELTAMKSAGLSLGRIFRPLIIFIGGLSIVAFFFANNIWPIANLKYRTLLFSIVQQKPALSLTEGQFYDGIDGISIRVMKKNTESGELQDILIYDHREPGRGNRTVIRAEKGNMQQTEDKRWLILQMQNGVTYDELDEKRSRHPKHPALSSHFDQMTLRIDISSLFFSKDDEEVFKNAFEMMTINQLDHALTGFDAEVDSMNQYWKVSNDKKLRLTEDLTKIQPSPASLQSQMPLTIQGKTIQAAIDASRRDMVQIQKIKIEKEDLLRFANRHKIEWHRKFFLAISCFVLFFVGAPLGAIIRKGGLGLPSVIALLLFIVFEMLTIAGEKMAKAFIIEPWLGMWISTIVMVPICILVMYSANQEKSWNIPDFKSWFKKKNKAL